MNLVEKIRAGFLDEASLLEYVTDNDIKIAIAVAQCPTATPAILDIAAHDSDPRVRRAALNNPRIGIETIKYLCADQEAEISTQAKIILEGDN